MKLLFVLCLLPISIVLGGDGPFKCKIPLDLMVVLDSSGSVATNFDAYMLPFVVEVRDKLDIGDFATQLGVVVYSTTIASFLPLCSPTEAQILGLTPGGLRTATGLGIQKAKELLIEDGRDYAKKVVVVITDGKANEHSPPISTAVEETYVAFPNAEFIAVGVQPDPGFGELDEDELRLIASGYLDENVFVCANFTELIEVLEDLICILCNPEPPCTDDNCPYHFIFPLTKGKCLDVGCCWNAADLTCKTRPE